MSPKVLLIAKISLLGLMSIPSLAYSYVSIWVDVPIRCPSPHKDPLIIRCEDYYEFTIEDDEIYWRGEKVLDADPQSFEMISRYYAKDKNNVYQNFSEAYHSYYDSNVPGSRERQYQSWVISTTHDNFWEIIYLADPKTFKIHPQYHEYSYDKNHLYYKGLLVAKTDGSSLKQLNNEYWTTNDAVFSYDQLLPQVDAESFIIFADNRRVTKDKNNVYFDNGIQRDVRDPLSFQVLNRDVGKDAVNIYAIDSSKIKLEPKKESTSFQIIDANNNISKDKDHIYHREIIVEGADIDSFQLLSNEIGYAKDHAKIFWLDWRSNWVLDVDFQTFKVDAINPKWAKDQDDIFYEGKKVEGLDAKTFEVLGQKYFKDISGIYFQTSQLAFQSLDGVDMESFSIIDEVDPAKVDIFNWGSDLSKDKHHVYYKGNIIEGADSETFKFLDKHGDFATDKNYAFLKKDNAYNILKMADRASFTLGKYGYDAEDKNNEYSSTGRVTSKTASKNTQKCNCSSKKKATNGKSQNKFIQLNFDQEYPSKYFLDESKEQFNFSRNSPYMGDRAGTYQVKTHYWKNSKTVTYGKQHLIDLDVNSFIVVGANFGKDHQYVYYKDQLIEGADTESFIVLDSDYSRDKNQLFYQQNKVTDLTQNNTVEKPYRHYYGGELLKRAYSDELEIYHQLPYAKVGTDVFYQDELIKQIDSQTLNPVRVFRKNYRENSSYTFSKYYIRDERNIYYQAEKIEGADPNSFIVTNEPDENSRFRNTTNGQDKFSCYEETKAVKCK